MLLFWTIILHNFLHFCAIDTCWFGSVCKPYIRSIDSICCKHLMCYEFTVFFLLLLIKHYDFHHSRLKWNHDSIWSDWVMLIYNNTGFNLETSWICRGCTIILLRYLMSFDYDQPYINHWIESCFSVLLCLTTVSLTFDFRFLLIHGS